MPMNAVYDGPGDLADVIPVFPLPGALLLPRGQMPLNIFEPRYIAMIDDALRAGHRLIGMIQPDAAHPGPGRQAQSLQGRLRRPHHPDRRDRRRPLPPPAHRHRRFRIEEELDVSTPYRQCRVTYTPFVDDFTRPQGRRGRRPREPAARAVRFSQGQRSQGRLGGHRERAQRGAGQRAGDDVALRGGREAGAAGSARPQDPGRDPGRHHRDRAGQEDLGRRDAPAMKSGPVHPHSWGPGTAAQYRLHDYALKSPH